MADQDPLDNFIGNIAEKIKLAKEHKDIMQAVQASASNSIIENQQDPFANLMQKIGDTIASKLPPKEQSVVVETTQEQQNEPEAAVALANKIKQALEQAKTQQAVETVVQIEPVANLQPDNTADVIVPLEEQPVETTDADATTRALAQKIRDAIESAKNKALNKATETPSEQNEEPSAKEPEELTDKQITSYIDELEKIKDTGTVKQKEEASSTLKELKEYIDKTVKDYSRKILELGGGGGSVATQYANGGVMNGNLNVNGHILSGGRNISDYFGSGGGGGGSGDPAVNALVHSNSGQWDSAYTNLVTNSAAYLLSGTEVYLGDIPGLSGNWNSNYTTTNYFSAFWNAAVDQLFNFFVTQNDPGSAFVSEDGNYYIIANSKLDNVNLWNNVFTQVFLLSSRWDSVYVTVVANSGKWESVYSTVRSNSGGWESAESTVATTSANWSSVYNTYQSLSASYATETLAIAYAVAL